VNPKVRSRILIPIAAVLALVAVACTNPEPASGNHVLVVGDSLLEHSQPEVAAALFTDGWQPDIRAAGGTTIVQWIDRVPLAVVNNPPNVVVIELGTNDCASGTCPPLGPYIDGIMQELAGVDAVLWLNTEVERSPRGLAYKSEGESSYVNREIEDAAARHPKLFLVDMNDVFEGHPELHSEDGIHFNDEGQRQFAELIRDALEPFKPL
jgi:lysophospholipase L1-like esterase